jgi:hypothetical protein
MTDSDVITRKVNHTIKELQQGLLAVARAMHADVRPFPRDMDSAALGIEEEQNDIDVILINETDRWGVIVVANKNQDNGSIINLIPFGQNRLERVLNSGAFNDGRLNTDIKLVTSQNKATEIESLLQSALKGEAIQSSGCYIATAVLVHMTVPRFGYYGDFETLG